MVYQDEKIVTEKSRTTIVNLERLGAKKRRRVNENVQNTVVRDLFGSSDNGNRTARSLFMDTSPVSRSFEASPAAVGRDPFEEEFSDDVQRAEEEDQEYQQDQEDQEVPRALFGGAEENLQETLSVNEDEMLY